MSRGKRQEATARCTQTTGSNHLRPTHRGPFSVIEGKQIALAFATPSTWEGYAGQNFETELASFWCLDFRHEDLSAFAPDSRDPEGNTRSPSRFCQGWVSGRWLHGPGCVRFGCHVRHSGVSESFK